MTTKTTQQKLEVYFKIMRFDKTDETPEHYVYCAIPDRPLPIAFIKASIEKFDPRYVDSIQHHCEKLANLLSDFCDIDEVLIQNDDTLLFRGSLKPVDEE